MHMMIMLTILSAVFFIALGLMCYFRDKLASRLFDMLFVVANAICFFCWNYAAYERGWLRDGFMTLENISPYICTVIMFTPFLAPRVKDFVYSAIAFFGFGMFVALYVSPGAEYFAEGQYAATFAHVSEAACHLMMGLYGFYLVLSNKVKLEFKSIGKACVFTYASIAFGVFLNLCFRLSNFGMNMYGGYSIYFLDIFGSFAATFVAYIVGVFGVILLGFLAAMFLDWISRPKVSGEQE